MIEGEVYTTIGDHLEDLRRTIVHILWTIGLGFLLALCCYEPIFHILIHPIHFSSDSSQSVVRQTLQHERITNTTQQFISYKVPKQAGAIVLQGNVTKLSSDLYHLAPQSYIEYTMPSQPHLILLSPLEGMMAAFKICFWTSLAATSPIWIFWVLQFIAPGLSLREKAYIFPFVLGSFIFLTMGLSLAYWITIPLSNAYLSYFNTGFGLNQWALMPYLNYTLVLLCGHAVAFEACLILLFLVHFGLLTPAWLIRKRRWMIVFAFILGAILTPPDILTQFLLALPLIVLYEVAILYAKMREKVIKRKIIAMNWQS